MREISSIVTGIMLSVAALASSATALAAGQRASSRMDAERVERETQSLPCDAEHCAAKKQGAQTEARRPSTLADDMRTGRGDLSP